MNSQKFWIITAAISGFLGVTFGAFGAHYLKSQLSPEMLEIFKTGVFYQLMHSVVILAVSFQANPVYFKSNRFFLGGILLFSFSLYLYTVTSLKFFAMITPFGGVLFLAGWISIIILSIKRNQLS
ncbi:MAG TPA: DUF423 domain-containing protein [Ignavibacteria bacterium]|nr:DUF423 domain-containing protein [Ignavibacteria bacterium]